MRFHPLFIFIMMSFLFLITSSFVAAEEDENSEKKEIAKEVFEISAKKAVKFIAEAETGVIPVNVTVVGEGADLSGKVEVSDGVANGAFKVDLTQFKTGLDGRDEHLQETLKTDKYKFAYLGIKDVKISQGEYSFKGNLKLNNIEKEVSGVVIQKGKHIDAQFIINLKEFQIELPKTIMTKLGASVDDKVKIEIKFDY